MSNLNVCRAKNPDTCKYHGKHSGAHANVLKAKAKIAYETYKALENSPVAYTAYEDYKKAQLSFYATDEGLQELTNILTKGDSADIEQSQRLYDKAVELRATVEIEDTGIVPPAKIMPLPIPQTGAENNILSTFVNQFNQQVKIWWDSSTSNIHLEEGTNSECVIGRAENLTEALYKATMWYNKNIVVTDN